MIYMRTNVYKKNIISVLRKAHLLSIADIQKKVPQADFSTVFRNIEQMCKSGEVKKVSLSKDTTLYELVSDHGHDHFVCDGCGLIESLDVQSKISLSSKRAKISDVVVHGVCARCVS